MNRRDFIAAMTVASAAGVSAVPEIRPASHEWRIEPPPRQFDFIEAQCCCMDVGVNGVASALEKLQWDSADPVKPLLVVSPEDYPTALEIAVELNQRVAIWATPCVARYAWFVAWRGRRVGSEGA